MHKHEHRFHWYKLGRYQRVTKSAKQKKGIRRLLYTAEYTRQYCNADSIKQYLLKAKC